MSNIDKIKAEIEKRLELYDPAYTNAGTELKNLLSFIESLEKAEDFPTDLERDAVSYCYDHGVNITPRQAREIASHYLMVGHKEAHIKARELGLPSSLDDSLPKIKGWVARDKAEEFEEIGYLHLFASKPHREYGCYWIGTCCYLCLDKTMFPGLRWKDEPIEVELTIHRV